MRTFSPVSAFVVLLFGALAAFATLPDLLAWLRTPEGKEAYGLWFGTKTVFDVTAGVLTTIIATIAAFLAWKSYGVNQRAAVANRYQKGVELLGASADSTKLGGIELLSVVAREAHKEYQEPVVRTLRQFMRERCESSVVAVRMRRDEAEERSTPVGTDLVVKAALSAIARTHSRYRWVEREFDDEGLTLFGLYLHEVRFKDFDFSRVHLRDAVFGDVLFERCTFAESVLDVGCFGEITFRECTFHDFNVWAETIGGKQIEDPDTFIKFYRASANPDVRVNGRRLGQA